MLGELQKRIKELSVPSVSMIEDGYEIVAEMEIEIAKVVEEMQKEAKQTSIYLPLNAMTIEEKFEMLMNQAILRKQFLEKWLK